MSEDQTARVGKYQILGQIGEGAMGVVYRALDPIINRSVAIKVMSDALARDADLRGRFLREAQSAGSLQHPNVVTIYDFGEVDGHLFIAMEFVEGADLDELLRNKAPLSAVEKIDILVDVLNGLAYAHKRGIVHRDVKPANIRIDEEGRARIMDFGIAHLNSSNMTRTGMTVGTPAYMSPEQITGGSIGPQSDIFAVGAVMYELFNGAQAFGGGETLQSVMYKIVTAPAPDLVINAEDMRGPQLAGASKALASVVSRALAKNPADRYESALDMAAALGEIRGRILGGNEAAGTLRATVARAMASTSESEVRKARQRRTIAIATGTGAVALVAILALVLVKPSRRDANADSARAASPAPATSTPTTTPAPVTPAPVAPPAQTKPSARETPTTASSAKTTRPTVQELELFRALQSTALDARRRAADAGATGVQLDSGDEHTRVANTLILEGKTSEAGEHLKQASSLWSSAERNARAASTAAATRASVAEQPKPQVVPPPVSVVSQPPVQQAQAPVQAPQVAAPPPPNPSAEIGAAVSTYARALESRDLSAVRRAYPGITQAQAKGWEQFFPTLRSLRVSLSISDLDINGATADAKLSGAYDYVTGAGKSEHQPVTFQASFRREGTTWLLVAVH